MRQIKNFPPITLIKKRGEMVLFKINKIKICFINKVVMILLNISLTLTTPSLFAQSNQPYAIPDSNFEKELITLGIDKDQSINGLLNNNDLSSVKELNLYGKKIYDLTGIEAFINLENLDISFNQIQLINLQNNKKIVKLNCDNNNLSDLNLENQLFLEILSCNNNKINTLDLTYSVFLRKVSCANNKITNIKGDLSNVDYLNISQNELTEIDLSKSLKLEKLICNSNNLICLDLSKNTNLDKLNCSDNNLLTLCIKNGYNSKLGVINTTLNPDLNCIEVDRTDINNDKVWLKDPHTNFTMQCTVNVPDPNFEKLLINLGYDIGSLNQKIVPFMVKDVKILDVSKSNISDLQGISAFENLEILYCNNNNLKNLDLSKNLKIKEIYCYNNNIENLNITGLSNLKIIQAHKNQIQSINLETNKELTYVNLSKNKLSYLDIRNSTYLEKLYITDNVLKELKMDYHPMFDELDVSNNLLTFLDSFKFQKIETLKCSSNNLSSLDCSQYPQLKYLYCFDNQLDNLKLDNPNLSELRAYNNLLTY